MRTRALLSAFLGVVVLVLLASLGAVPGGARQMTERTKGDVVGASVSHPKKWFVEREKATYDGTYGFTLWDPKPQAVADDGGVPEVRVARAYDLKPGGIRERVKEKMAFYKDLSITRRDVRVGEKRIKGVAIGPIPGSIASTEVYVAYRGRVYQINVYGEKSGAELESILSTLRFYQPLRSVSSLKLKDAAHKTPAKGEKSAPNTKKSSQDAVPADGSLVFTTQSTSGERRIYEGCWRADPSFFFQTQHDSYANRSSGDRIHTGFTVIGRPNFWGQYTHGNLGYGRCNEPYYTNDKFAVDYPLDRGDRIFSPFRRGTVTFAGRNYTHKNYGNMVVIRAAGGKYVSLSGHLSSIPSSIYRGKTVYSNSLIGYAGNTGDSSVPVGEVHLHQAFYRYPHYNRDGSPYGGQGLKVVRFHYSGTAARRLGIPVSSHIYLLSMVKPNYKRYCREGVLCGEGYRISN